MSNHPYESWELFGKFICEGLAGDTFDTQEFIRCWNHGEWDSLDEEWPEWKEFVEKNTKETFVSCSYHYDQDPRYGWVSINIGSRNNITIIIENDDGQTLGYVYNSGEISPKCICHAYEESECCCPNV